MKTTSVIGKWSCVLAFALLSGCQGNADQNSTAAKAEQGTPLFSNFNYTGSDQIYNERQLAEGEFYSPILQGCYPDPSITRKGNDYYLVNSSFVMFPGVPIFHSNDLVNWKQIGHVLDRETQLKVSDAGISEGIYAPDIMYNPHNDTFYMITTQIASGIGNMVVKTQDPKIGNWSDPIKLNFGGIDPALFFDEDGKAYVVHNDAPDEGKEKYKGHRVIKIWEYDVEKDQVIEGSSKIIVDGGVDIDKKPIWIEAPHIYKRNSKYYLMCAEGGTGGNHSEVVFVSDDVKGPYVPAERNPILSQRHLDKSRPNRVEWAGHADIVEGNTGEWYGVFLAVRPNDAQRVNTGRETFILPVDWSGEWPVFEGGMDPLKPAIRMPKGAQNLQNTGDFVPNGNFVFTDAFSDKELDDRWVALRGPRESFVELSGHGAYLNPYPVDISEKKPISALFFRQQHNTFAAEVEMSYSPRSPEDLAGLTCIQSEQFNYVLGVTLLQGEPHIVLTRTESGQTTIIAKQQLSSTALIQLRVEADGDNYQFSYAQNGNPYKNIGSTVSGDILSTDVAGGFTGAMVGLYSTSANKIKL